MCEVLVDLAHPFQLKRPTGEIDRIVAYIRYYGMTVTTRDDAFALIQSDVKDGALVLLQCGEVDTQMLQPRMFNTGNIISVYGTWHKSGRVFINEDDREDQFKAVDNQ